MDEKEFCKKLLDLKPPWFVQNVIMNEGEHTLDIFVDHPKGIKFPCHECGMESIVYDLSLPQFNTTVQLKVFPEAFFDPL